MQPFQIGFFLSDICISLSSMSFHGLLAHFSLALNSIPLCGWTTVYLSTHVLKGILVTSEFGQIMNKTGISIHMQGFVWI